MNTYYTVYRFPSSGLVLPGALLPQFLTYPHIPCCIRLHTHMPATGVSVTGWRYYTYITGTPLDCIHYRYYYRTVVFVEHLLTLYPLTIPVLLVGLLRLRCHTLLLLLCCNLVGSPPVPRCLRLSSVRHRAPLWLFASTQLMNRRRFCLLHTPPRRGACCARLNATTYTFWLDAS